MPGRGRPPATRGVVSFEDTGWRAPDLLLLDTSVLVDALVPTAPSHESCAALFRCLVGSRTTVVYNELLRTELCEALFRLALKERWGGRGWRQQRYDGRARRRASRLLDQGLASFEEVLNAVDSASVGYAVVQGRVPSLMKQYGLASYDAVHVATAVLYGIEDVATLDGDFAAVPEREFTVHTTRSRLSSMRKRRRRS